MEMNITRKAFGGDEVCSILIVGVCVYKHTKVFKMVLYVLVTMLTYAKEC
jgi:hypothetical protein